jgi:hypothetical protein
MGYLSNDELRPYRLIYEGSNRNRRRFLRNLGFDRADLPESGIGMKNWKLILRDIDETMRTSIDNGVPTIHLGRFETAIRRKQRMLVKPNASLEEHVADCFSHEVVHIIVYENAPGDTDARYAISGVIDFFPFNSPFSAECGIFDPSELIYGRFWNTKALIGTKTIE